MKSAIVTGATGFIGTHLIDELLRNGVEVTALVRSGSLKKDVLSFKRGIEIVEYDSSNIFDLSPVFRGRNADVMFDLAWEGVAGDKRGDYKVQLRNVEHSADALMFAGEIGCKRFVGSSSVSEFECYRFSNIDGARMGKRFIYSTAKMTSHYMNKCLAANNGIEYINANIANTYGPKGLASLIVHDTIIKLMNHQRTMFTKGDQLYDFLYVTDIAKGLFLVGEKGHSLCSYYIGSANPRPLKEYLMTIRDCVSPDSELGLGELAADGMFLPEEVFDCSKIMSHTGFNPEISFKDGVRLTVAWLSETGGANK